MSLLSKLFGDNKTAESALDFMKNAAKEVVETAEKLQKEKSVSFSQGSAPKESTYVKIDAPDVRSGDSWGEQMPSEENQYNFNGTYTAYFEHIFREEFPSVQFTVSQGMNPANPIYSFFCNGKKVLVLELKSESSTAQRFRKAAEKEGIPYLRFYYDHAGWWNTRSYVVGRMRKVLG